LEDRPVWAYRGYIQVGSTDWASYGCNGEGKRAAVRTQGTSEKWSTKGRLENSNTQGGSNNYVSLEGQRFAPHAWDDINVPNQGIVTKFTLKFHYQTGVWVCPAILSP
jgi:hypothetical protein